MLSVLVFMPLVGAALLLILRPSDANSRWVALGVTLLTFAISLILFGRFQTNTAGFQMVEDASWWEDIGLRYTLGVDGVSIFMVMLTTLFMPVAVLMSWSVKDRTRLYMVNALIIETAILGTFLSLNLLMFFLFFELLLFPMYLTIGIWGSDRRIYAAVKFVLFTLFGSAFLLVGILLLYAQSAKLTGTGTFDLLELRQLRLNTDIARGLFLLFFVGFAVKVPLFPLHTWLPDAHTEAPTKGSIVLAALLLKTGTYGMIRFNLGLFPEASKYFAIAISVLAVIGIIYGGIVAMMQTDLKRLIAYSSVSHLGLMVLGIFAFTDLALAGSVLQMVNHGLSTGLLFIVVGMLYERTHTREIGELGGLAKVTPWMAGFFIVAALSSLGLPGLNNFVGEFLVIVGTFAASHWFGILASVGLVLSAIYLLWSYQRTWTGPVPDRWKGLKDVNVREVALAAPIIAVIVLIGLYPKPFLDRIDASTKEIVRQVEVVAADGQVPGEPIPIEGGAIAAPAASPAPASSEAAAP